MRCDGCVGAYLLCDGQIAPLSAASVCAECYSVPSQSIQLPRIWPPGRLLGKLVLRLEFLACLLLKSSLAQIDAKYGPASPAHLQAQSFIRRYSLRFWAESCNGPTAAENTKYIPRCEN